MSRPAPDDEIVIAVYEKRIFDRWPPDRIVEWARTQPWGPISRSTVFVWIRRGAQLYTEYQRLDPDAEFAMHRQTVDALFDRLVEAVEAQRIDEDTFFRHSIRLLAEHRAAVGWAGAAAAPDAPASLTPGGAEAFERMLAERRAQNRRVIG